MKKRRFLIVLVGATLSTFMFSCGNSEVLPDDYYTEDEIVTMEHEFVLAPATRDIDALPITGSLFMTVNTNAERIVSYTVSPEVLKAANMTAGEFDDYLRENMDRDDYLDLTETGGDGSDYTQYGIGKDLNECLDYCTKTYTDAEGKKIPGRGRCKARCWGVAAIEILEKFVNTFSKII